MGVTINKQDTQQVLYIPSIHAIVQDYAKKSFI